MTRTREDLEQEVLALRGQCHKLPQKLVAARQDERDQILKLLRALWDTYGMDNSKLGLAMQSAMAAAIQRIQARKS